jgi:biopolymer transport protein ExbD
MGAKVGGSKKGMDEINVTPLIDVVLVLLIIFMVMTPKKIQNMASNLPPEDTEEPPPPPPDKPPDQLMLAVYADGTTALNLEPYTSDDALRDILERRLAAKDKKTVFVDAHPDAPYGRVVSVMDLARDAGAEKIGFADLKDEGPARLEAGAALPAAAPTPG